MLGFWLIFLYLLDTFCSLAIEQSIGFLKNLKKWLWLETFEDLKYFWGEIKKLRSHETISIICDCLFTVINLLIIILLRMTIVFLLFYLGGILRYSHSRTRTHTKWLIV